MKNAIRYILILIILVIIFIILNFYKSKKNIFEDIMIFVLWGGNSIKNEYGINSQSSAKYVFECTKKAAEITIKN